MTASLVGLVVALAVGAMVSTVSGTRRMLAGVRTRQRVLALLDSPAAASPWSPLVSRTARRVRAWTTAATGGTARARRHADGVLPALLDQITRQLRSGASLPVAVRTAAASATDGTTLALAEEIAAGSGLAPAVERWRRACPTPSRGLVAAALTLAADAGGSVAAVLDGVSDTLRDRVALDREVAALSSQARASAAVLVVAPVGFAAIAAAADHRVAAVLLGRPLGWVCMAAGAALDAAGALWMSRLVGRSR